MGSPAARMIPSTQPSGGRARKHMPQQWALSVTRYRESTVVHERVRERLKEAFWFTPGLFAVAAIGLALGMQEFDRTLSVREGTIGWWEGSVANAGAIASSVTVAIVLVLASLAVFL